MTTRAPLLAERLRGYLRERAGAPVLIVGEAPGDRGTRVSGIPLTSERQLTGAGHAEATASVVHGALAELGLASEVLLWNVVPTHPGGKHSNRRPTAAEVAAGLPFALELARGRRVVPLGRIAHACLGGSYLRHPPTAARPSFGAGSRCSWLRRRAAAAAAPGAHERAGLLRSFRPRAPYRRARLTFR